MAKNLLLVCLSLVLVAGALEVFFRLRPDRDLQTNNEYAYRERIGEKRFRVPFHTWHERYPEELDRRGYYAASDYEVGFHFNQHGARWHAAEEQVLAGRVTVVLGDSFTYGSGLRYGDTWVAGLEERLRAAGRRVSFVNFGRAGADSVGSLAIYREVRDEVAHDAAFYAVHLNDLVSFDTSFVIRNQALDNPLAQHSAFVAFVVKRLNKGVGRRLKLAYLTSPRVLELPRFGENFEAIVELAGLARRRGVEFDAVLLPVLVELETDPFRPLYREIAQRLTDRGVRVIDLTETLKGHPERDLWILPIDQHPNEVASALWADALAASLEEGS